MHERSGIPFRRMTAIGFSVSLLAVLAGCGGTSLPRHAASDSSEVSDTAAAETKREAERPAASEETSTVTGAPAATSQSPPTVEQNMLASRAGSNASGNPPAAALVPPQRFRLPDDRPALNRDELMAEGVRVVESEHLILVTDLPLESVVDLPPLADALFATLEQRLGKLAPDIAGTKFQVTGFLIDARDRFERAGVLPSEEYPIRHGRHLGYRFWMNNQTADYYRRHLLLHEFVHCFLMCEFGMLDIPPLWYTEGIAEYYATHRLHPDIAKSEFGILPSSVEGFEGWHRIAEIRRHFNQEPSVTGELADIVPLQTVLHPPASKFQDDSQYANVWALVWLINHHPELQPDFAAVAACRSRQQYEDAIGEIPELVWKQLDQVWPLYLDGLHEADVAAVRFPALTGLRPHARNGDIALPTELVLDAGQHWASTGISLTAGQEILIECKGRYVVEETTKPWIAEPDGITIDYVDGRPLGEVIGAIVSADGTQTTSHIPIGTQKKLRSPIDGTLWLQTNDYWSKREKNHGTVTVGISNGTP
ncbi:MAG: hypothetical protein DWI22_08670 [Planctomycetota bacterium]|nr:MAG: hypothetical protein DWI22_08670 [Planctomycetota bacterium]